jgi:hypothetical protein
VTWTTEGQTFWRATTVRHDETLALVVGPTANRRWQARCGAWSRSTHDIAASGNLLTIEATPERAKLVATGWATGV